MVATLIHTGHTDEWTDRQADGGAEERMDEETTCSHFRRRERFYGDVIPPATLLPDLDHIWIFSRDFHRSP